VDMEHAREQIALYGRENPWVKATILGEFPDSGFNTLLTVEQIEEAMERHHAADMFSFSQKRLGMDVARFGDDRTVIFPRQGIAAFEPVIMRGTDSSAAAARLMQAKIKWDSDLELIDCTGGFGSGVFDAFKIAGYSPIDVQFGASATEHQRYANLRAEMWFKMADWVKGGGALPNVPDLVAELTVPTYSFQKGKFLMEPKEIVKKTLKRSPDLADALACTFALPDMPKSSAKGLQKKAKCENIDFDPMREM
jgi:phage terminase large subunit